MATKKQIEAKVARLSSLTGVPYQTNYARHYGGYNLFYKTHKGSGDYRGKYGFDLRKSTREMNDYLDKILNELEG